MKKLLLSCSKTVLVLGTLLFTLSLWVTKAVDLSHAAGVDPATSKISQGRRVKIAIAKTWGLDGDPQIVQEKISSKLNAFMDVIKINAQEPAPAASAAKENECDFVVLTKLAVNGRSIQLSKVSDKADNTTDNASKSKLPGFMKKGKGASNESDKSTDKARNGKGPLNIKSKDKVTLTYQLVSVNNSSPVSNLTQEESAESEEQIVEKLVNKVVQDVVAKAVVSSLGETHVAAGNKSRDKSGDETGAIKKDNPLPPVTDSKSANNSVTKRATCNVSSEQLPKLRGLRLGMADAEVRKLLAPNSKLKPNSIYNSESEGAAEIRLTARDFINAKEFILYKSVTLRIIDGKVAIISLEYSEKNDLGSLADFTTSAGEVLQLPEAWELQAQDALMTCQGFEIKVSLGDRALRLTDLEATDKKKKKKVKI